MHAGLVKAVLGLAAVMMIIDGIDQPRVAIAGTIADVPCDAAMLAKAIRATGSGGVLTLARSCVYQLAAALPTVSRDLTIRGENATLERSFATGTPDFSILTVAFGNLTVSDLNFRNGGSGSSAHRGGGILGGAIDNVGGTVSVTGGSFVGNGADFGGAIANNVNRSFTATGTVFTGNRAYYGGAVDNEGTASIAGATFTGNKAQDWGGAILTLRTGTLSRCVLSDNRATLGGGLFASGTATVSGSDLRGNKATLGGGIFNDDALRLTDSRLLGNTATLDGGGFLNDISGQATVTGAVFWENQAGFDGGGTYNENMVDISGSRMFGNLSHHDGGAIYTDWILSASGSDILGNVAGAGGGIYNGDFFGPPGTVSLLSTRLVDNLPDDCAGCLASDGRPPLLPRPHPQGPPGLGFAARGAAQATNGGRPSPGLTGRPQA